MGETLPLIAEELTDDASWEIISNQYLMTLYKKQREIAISQFSLLFNSNWLYYDLGIEGLPTECRDLQKRYHFPLNKKKIKENKTEFSRFIKKYGIDEDKNKKAWDNLQKKVSFHDLW